MLNLARDINSLSNFKRHTQEFIQQLKATGAPVVLTVNGVSELVIQNAESYQKLLDRLEYLETIQGIQEGLDKFDQGKRSACHRSTGSVAFQARCRPECMTYRGIVQSRAYRSVVNFKYILKDTEQS